jgi:UDP-glucuronate 4-epimerase
MTAPAGHERFLVTGAHGCIGAWVVRQLLAEHADVVALDVSDDAHRLRLLMTPDELAGLRSVRTDITDLDAVERTLDEHEITNIIHLAALQVPFCQADPALGARVNVVGTINVMEAAARRLARMAPLVYASSIAVYSKLSPEQTAGGERADAHQGVPGTLYGVYKRANEGAAVRYWQDRGLPSIGLRPHTVYGPGRDQGLTSAPTVAILAAVSGNRFEVSYGGRLQLQYAPDVARAFVQASRSGVEAASVHNLKGQTVHMADVVDAIEAAIPDAAGLISFKPAGLAFPQEVDSGSLTATIGNLKETPLAIGVDDSVARFRALLSADLLAPAGEQARDPAAHASPAPSGIGPAQTD